MAPRLTPHGLLMTAATGGASLLLERIAQATGRPSAISSIADRVAAVSGPPPPPPRITPVQSVGVSVQRGPTGWLGRVIEMGGRALAFELEYMLGTKYGGHYHLAPMLAATRASKSSDPDLDWSRSTLMTERFCEPPCPAFPRCGPMFLLGSSRDAYARYTDVYGSKHASNGGSSHDWFVAAKFLDPADVRWGWSEERRLYKIGSGEDPYADVLGRLRVRNTDGAGELVYPARRVRDWAEDTLGLRAYRDKQLERTQHAIETINGTAAWSSCIIVPERYRGAELGAWLVRLGEWFRNGQYLAWCGVIACCEHGTISEPPSWYRDHALAWGIGVPTGDQWATRKRYFDYDDGIRTKMTAAQLWDVLRQIVIHTPPPGSAGWLGEQIREDVDGRTLCDMPDDVGSLLPQIDLVTEDNAQWWVAGALHKWNSKYPYDWIDSMSPYLNALISMAGAGLGSAATAAVAAAAGSAIGQAALHMVVTLSLQAVTRMGRGQNPFPSKGDIVGMIGDAVSSSGLADDLHMDSVPPELWDALQTVGKAIPRVPGVDNWHDVENNWLDVQGRFDAIRRRGWDYITEGYGGMGLTASASNATSSLGLPSSNIFS
jgi:hypothetical protein